METFISGLLIYRMCQQPLEQSFDFWRDFDLGLDDLNFGVGRLKVSYAHSLTFNHINLDGVLPTPKTMFSRARQEKPPHGLACAQLSVIPSLTHFSNQAKYRCQAFPGFCSNETFVELLNIIPRSGKLLLKFAEFIVVSQEDS